MDDFFRTQQPRGEPQGSPAFMSPPRNGPALPRRFTADSSRVPTLSSISTIPRAAEPQDFAATSAMHRVQLQLEKKRQEYERLREHKRRFEAEMYKLDAQQRQEERELLQMHEDLLARYGGHQSEPTTPPEYRDTAGFPSIFSRPNRYSTSSLTSPPGLFNNRPGRSGSLLTSPLSGTLPSSRFPFDDIPSHSVPGSRRNSDEDEKEEAVRQDPTSHRSTKALNRYSMPVTRSRTYLSDVGLEDSNNTTGFLFGDEDSNSADKKTPIAQVSTTEPFPSLFRQQPYPSINMSTMASSQHNTGAQVGSPSEASTIGSNRPANIRHSIDGLKFFPESTSVAPEAPATSVVSPPSAHTLASPPKLVHQSYSANDVPTVKTNGTTGMGSNANNHAQQHFHNHNASMGRIPAGVMTGRHNRELSGDASSANGRENGNYPSITSTLHANAPPFGPSSTQPQPQQASSAAAPAVASPGPAMPYPYYPANPGYNAMSSPPPPPAGYNSLPMLMQGLTVGNGNPYAQHNFTGYNPHYGQPPAPRQHQDSQARVIQSRRQMDNEAMARFNNLPLEQVGGTIYSLCKDQHGCRYLQKQLENRIPEQIHMIWLETNQHVVELMTDPFGNYLCQKLLEYCNDDERTVLIQNATSDMVRIALNQHGTRALQKMIEHVTTPVQINLIIEALRNQVVELIQDLNGNHVIQKCLNKLSAADASFIFEAVGKHCVEVGTHRHGCCVLQRCIDHADGQQKVWLIECITAHAVTLVQDPFGNYVVQYIIDLNEETFTEPLVQQFKNRIAALSKHKFSSNVVEKCLRCASEQSRDMIVSELLAPGEIDRLLRDSYGNYVIQTALDYSTPLSKHHLVEAIRPSLPGIRATPYGRRIQAKVQAYDTRMGSGNDQRVLPTDPAGGQISIRQAHNRGMPNGAPMHANGGYVNGANGVNGGVVGANMYQANPAIAMGAPQNHAPPQPPRAQQFSPPFSPGSSTTDNGETQWV